MFRGASCKRSTWHRAMVQINTERLLHCHSGFFALLFFLSFALIGLFLKCIDQLVRLELFSYPKEKRKLLNDVKAEKKN